MVIIASIVFRNLSRSLLVKPLPHNFVRAFTVSATHGQTSKLPILKPPPPILCEEEVEVYIDNLSNLGMGVGRKSFNGISWVIMVPFVLPGELVKVRIKRNLGSYSEADLLEVITPSNARVTPPCRYFATCGGCQYQHMDITMQRKWKASQVSAALQRIAKIENVDVKETVGTEHVYKYRAKLTPHCANASSSVQNEGNLANKVIVGFQVRNTNDIVDVEECIVASDAINAEYRKVRNQLAVKDSESQLLFREFDGGITTDPHKLVSHTVNGITFQFKAGEFFQNNLYMLPLMVQHVVTQAAGDGCAYLIDAYCGSGLFALSAAKQFKKVLGIEVSQASVNAAVANARSNNISNVEFARGEAQHIFKQAKKFAAADTVVVLDPPRRGCDAVFLHQLIAFAPRKVVYVSCEPTTQARDAQRLMQAGYRIADVTPFDLFPQTRHIENVMTFLKP